ncbi:hypothetical protein [Streptomyces sp. XY152]|nr:hypothetical protein [Streptomyces sp. XY152]
MLTGPSIPGAAVLAQKQLAAGARTHRGERRPEEIPDAARRLTSTPDPYG